MVLAFVDFQKKRAADKPTKGRGSIRGSISIGGDMLKKGGGARPVRRGLSKEKRAAIASLAAADDEVGGSNLSFEALPKEPKTPAELARIREALGQHFLFVSLTDEQRGVRHHRPNKAGHSHVAHCSLMVPRLHFYGAVGIQRDAAH